MPGHVGVNKMTKLYAVATLALLNGGYMIFDAIHQYSTGDFVRIEGQLGPWANIVSYVGINPLSLAPVFLVFGISQIFCAFGLIRMTKWGYRGTKFLAIASLLYLVTGTFIAAIQLILLHFARKPTATNPT